MRPSPLLLLFVLLSLLTLLFHWTVDVCEEHPPPAETAAQLREFPSWLKSKAGTITATPELLEVSLSGAPYEAGASVVLDAKKLHGKTILLRADIRTDKVLRGKLPWEKARFIFVQYVQGKPDYSVTHALAVLLGSHDWQTYEQVFTIAEDTEQIRASLQLPNALGKIWCRNIEMQILTPNPLYGPLRTVVLSLWGALLATLCMVWWARGGNRGVLLLLLVLTVFGTTMPPHLKKSIQHDLDNELSGLEQLLNRQAEQPPPQKDGEQSPLPVELSKVAHFVLFFFLACVLLPGSSGRRYRLIWLELLMLALATEQMQLLIDGRTARFSDIAVDMGGVLSAEVVRYVWLKVRGEDKRSRS